MSKKLATFCLLIHHVIWLTLNHTVVWRRVVGVQLLLYWLPSLQWKDFDKNSRRHIVRIQYSSASQLYVTGSWAITDRLRRSASVKIFSTVAQGRIDHFATDVTYLLFLLKVFSSTLLVFPSLFLHFLPKKEHFPPVTLNFDPSCQISRLKVISFGRHRAKTDRHTYQSECSIWTTKLSVKGRVRTIVTIGLSLRPIVALSDDYRAR